MTTFLGENFYAVDENGESVFLTTEAPILNGDKRFLFPIPNFQNDPQLCSNNYGFNYSAWVQNPDVLNFCPKSVYEKLKSLPGYLYYVIDNYSFFRKLSINRVFTADKDGELGKIVLRNKGVETEIGKVSVVEYVHDERSNMHAIYVKATLNI